MHRLYLLAVLAMCSCAPAYVANTRNAPLFGEAKEFAGAVVLASGVDLQLAGSVTDHIGIMANGSMLLKESTPEGEPSYNKSHRYFEGGIGYFGRSKAARYELYAGYGIGQGYTYESYFFFQATGQKSVIALGKYNRIFVQPSFGTNNRKFNLIFSPRFSLVNFSEFSTEDPAVAATRAKIKPTDKFQLMVEPSLTTRFHLVGNLHGFFQLNVNSAVPNDAVFDYERLTAAIGIQIHTGQLRTRVY